MRCVVEGDCVDRNLVYQAVGRDVCIYLACQIVSRVESDARDPRALPVRV